MRLALAPSALFLALSFGALGCAGSSSKSKTTVTPLTDEQRKAFDRGVDFIASLEGLEGRWRGDWDHDLHVRIGSADLVSAVTVTTTRTDSDPTQRVTYRLVAHVDRDLVGKHKEVEVELPSTPEDLGYTSVQENIARVPQKQFVLYLKHAADGPVWHLSPASPEVVTQTESQITVMNRGANAQAGERVIVHNN